VSYWTVCTVNLLSRRQKIGCIGGQEKSTHGLIPNLERTADNQNLRSLWGFKLKPQLCDCTLGFVSRRRPGEALRSHPTTGKKICDGKDCEESQNLVKYNPILSTPKGRATSVPSRGEGAPGEEIMQDSEEERNWGMRPSEKGRKGFGNILGSRFNLRLREARRLLRRRD